MGVRGGSIIINEEKNQIWEYLLGRLDEADEEQVELRLLTDPAFIEEFDIVVDEISIRYVQGGFEGNEKDRVERYFLVAPERQHKVKVISELQHRVSTVEVEKPTPQPAPAPIATDSGLFAGVRRFWRAQPQAFRFATTVAMLVIVVGVVMLVRSGRPTTSNYASLTLAISDAERGQQRQPNTANSTSLQPGIDELRIELLLPAQQTQPKTYRAEFAPPATLRNPTIVSQDARSVVVAVPASELKPDRYTIRLFAIYPDGREERIRGNYDFRIE